MSSSLGISLAEKQTAQLIIAESYISSRNKITKAIQYQLRQELESILISCTEQFFSFSLSMKR